MPPIPVRALAAWLLLVFPAAGQWQPPSTAEVRMTGQETWRLVSATDGEYTIESVQQHSARPGDAFEVSVRLRVDTHTRALPELASYDAQGREIPRRSSLLTGPPQVTTDWQQIRRVFPAAPGAATVRARVRCSGKGEVLVEGLEFRPKQVDPYETGALVSPIAPNRRRGLVLSSNLGIVNTGAISTADRDGDGKWALIATDLDLASQPQHKGEDWRTGFLYDPNQAYWFDGAVLKSDSVREDRLPDLRRGLHYRTRVHPGSYHVRINDPGRSVAVSTDGRTWRRFDGGAEAELGELSAPDGVLELWIDNCFRDAVSAGPVYFDYVRLFAVDNAPSADRLFAEAQRGPSRLDRGAAEDRRVAVTVHGAPPSGGGNWPVRSGLPIPRGELASARHVAVLDSSGRTVPSASRAMATWPDASVKWLFVDFRHDPTQGGTGRYQIRYGNRVTPAASGPGVSLRRSAAGVEVDTGALRFTVPTARFGIVQDVRLASGRLLQEGPLAAEVVEPDGRVWRASELPVSDLEIEQAGPLHAVIRVETRLAASGEPSTGFHHRARVHAYAGSPLLHIDYFVANMDSRPAKDVGGSMESKLHASSIALKFRPASAPTQARHGLANAGASGAVVQKSADAALVDGSEVTAHVPGWLSLSLKDGGGIQVGVRAFREQFPKAFRWRPDQVEIALWAGEGGAYEWYEGVGKTHQLALLYGETAAADAALLAQGPLLALAEPEWYASSGALGPLVPAARGLAAVEKSLAGNMRGPMVQEVGLGFENYGDHASPGYVKGSRLWDNNEYDTPAAGIVHFARTGDRDALRVALDGAQHYLDVDTIHYSRRHAGWAGAAHTHSHVTFGHHTAEAPSMHHAGYVQGLLWHSYLTGEPTGVLGARGIADWVLRNIRPQDNAGTMERALGHPLMTLTDTYEATWDDRYLRGAARLVDWAMKWEHPVLSGFMAPITEAPGFYAGSPGVGAGTLHAGLIKFNEWARLPEIDGMLERAARWTVTFPWRPPASLIAKAPVQGAPASALAMAENLRLMRHAFQRTGDPVFLVVPRQSVLEAFASGNARVNTRSTGRVYNYLPWFLTTLAEQGHPGPESGLTIDVDQASLRVAKGKTGHLTFRLRNTGSTPVETARFTLQPRLDLRATALQPPVEVIPPGEVRECRYEIQAPGRINLTAEANRISYAHFSGLYRRGTKTHTAHVPVKIEVIE